MRNQPKEKQLLPYQTIEKATQGDIIAIKIVIGYYQQYLNKVSSHSIHSVKGNDSEIVDEYMKSHLESKLIEKILDFDVKR